jgi:NAD(P)-dependent dehydrogenase (short-subunit alcohol dehydrogenase family)
MCGRDRGTSGIGKAIALGLARAGANASQYGVRGRECLTRTPFNRFGNVDELAGAAVFLASNASSYVAGEILVVDGGFLASGVNQ